MTHSFPPGSSSTVPRGGPLLRPYSPGMSHATASKQHPGKYCETNKHTLCWYCLYELNDFVLMPDEIKTERNH